MNLLHDVMYKVRADHPFHPGRIGRFQFLGGPKSDVIVLTDATSPYHMFAVGLRDLEDFNPDVDNIVQKEHFQAIRVFDHNEEVFDVRRRETVGKATVLWVFYPNCPNSNKIMVYHGYGPGPDATRIDPHFGRDGSPVARFVASEEGWNWALRFARDILGRKTQAEHDAELEQALDKGWLGAKPWMGDRCGD
jgi:hypothetical protein